MTNTLRDLIDKNWISHIGRNNLQIAKQTQKIKEPTDNVFYWKIQLEKYK